MVLILLGHSIFASPEAGQYMEASFTNLTQQIRHEIGRGWLSTTMFAPDSVKKWLTKLGKKQTALDRIVINPSGENGTVSMLDGDRTVFSATAIAGELPVGGIDFKWTVSAANGQHTGSLIAGVFEPKHWGLYTITAATVDGHQASVTVKVYPNQGVGVSRLLAKRDADLTENERAAIAAMRANGHLLSRSTSSHAIYNASSERQIYQADRAKLAAAEQVQEQNRQTTPDPFATPTPAPTPAGAEAFPTLRQGGPNANDGGYAPPPPAVAKERKIPKPKAMFFNRPAGDDGWNGSNWSTADDPGNWVGRPAGAAPDVGAGNGNFTINAPVLSLAGRGLDVNLSLIYNARLWEKSSTLMSYDNDRGWPAPGWNLGFGKMMYMGGTGGCMLVTPDGTRRSYDGTNYVYSYGSVYESDHSEHSTDGSFIDYSCSYYSDTYGQTLTGYASLPDGTTITYGSPSSSADQLYPTQITDVQGNYIDITYVGGHGPNIDTISDTLGRTITFNYDGTSGRLSDITAPAFGGGTPRTLVRLNYTAQTLSYAFASGYTTDVPGGDTQYVLKSIYYPDTNNGYWFGDSDSYSPYGMIAKVDQQRGMSWSSGTISSGTMTDKQTYDFPTTTISTLTDAPQYTQRAEDWAGRDTSSAAVTAYGLSTTSTDQVTTVTMPDGTVNKQTSHINPGYGDDGFYYQGEIYASSTASTPLAKTKTYFGSGDYGSTRPTKIEKTDELSQMTSTEFTYTSGSYNQLMTQKEYGYGGTTLYRQTNNTYETNSAYTSRHIFNLLKTTEVMDASGNRLTRTDYEHDNYTSNPLVPTTGVIHHNDTSDPYTTNTHLVQTDCLAWSHPTCGGGNFSDGGVITDSPYCICLEWDYEDVSNYDPGTDYRGNVTKTTNYVTAAGSSPSGGIDYDFTYDITGNQRTATTNCCQQMSFDYTDHFSDSIARNTYAFPTVHTKGSSNTSSPLRMSETAVYDFNTGAQTSSTDFNGLLTTTVYDAVVRPTLVTAPTSATTAISYDDANLAETTTSKLSDGTTIVSETSQTINGRGQPVYSKYLAGSSNWNATSVKYDAMGRKWKTSVPYDSASSPSDWTEFAYDGLSRLTQTTAPDGSTSKVFFDETSRPDSASSTAGNTVRSQDAWGRERWARTDAFGRLVEVVEPNPTGNGAMITTGTLATTYAYDELDQLLAVTQGGGSQTRSFKYDSLGRLTRQKLAEQTPTINDAGTYVGLGGTGANWSDAFTYDARSNVTQRVDARGVKTNFDYQISSAPDPLNRLQGISYDTSSADTTYTIDSAASVTVSYATSGDQTRVSQVSTTGISTETNSFDSYGRVSDYSLLLTARSGYAMTTSYGYDSANRLTQVTYPAQYGVTGTPRKTVEPSYDQASRLTQMKVDAVARLGGIGYNNASQVTALTVGSTSDRNYYTEAYGYDAQTGLLASQSVVRMHILRGIYSPTTIMDLSYGYARGSSNGTVSGKTGQLTSISNNLDHNKDLLYEFDAIGRLKDAKAGTSAGASGVTANWTQTYSYDRYGNKTGVAATGVTSDTNSVPTDGLSSVGYNAATNRINDAGWIYDNAGDLIRGKDQSGTWQRFEYDAAGRLVKVMDDSSTVLENYTYGATRERLVNETSSGRTYYAWGGSSVIQEYTETPSGTIPTYSKAYVYAGSRLFMTDTLGTVNYYHPDRLGTKLITAASTVTTVEQSTLPFGTELSGEESGSSPIDQKFTSYDRSAGTGLDYANNRIYSKGESRFTQVDPLQASASNLLNPQSQNLYAYTENMPTDFVDPSGLNMEIDWGSCQEAYGWDSERMGWVDLGYERCELRDNGRGGLGGEPGGGGGGTTQNKSKKPNCNTLAALAKKVRDELARRASELFEDILNLPPGPGPMTLTGHIQQFENKQQQLRNTLNEFDANGCGGPGPTAQVPADAWKWATGVAPRKNELSANSSSSAMTIAGGVVVTAATAYVIYRIVRMIPSVAIPPLWPTIPANAVIP